MRILLKYNSGAWSYYKKTILIAYQDIFLGKLQFLSNNCKQCIRTFLSNHTDASII